MSVIQTIMSMVPTDLANSSKPMSVACCWNSDAGHTYTPSATAGSTGSFEGNGGPTENMDGSARQA